MRKTIYFIFVLIFIFSSCELSVHPNNGVPDSDFRTPSVIYFPIEKNQTSISFDSAYNGKKAFLIYSNETNSNISISNEQILFNNNHSDSNNSEMIIYKNAIPLGNGKFRDEVQFNYGNIDKGDKITPNNSRTASNSYYYNNHTPDSNNESSFFCIVNNDRRTVSSETFTLKVTGKHCRIWAYNNNTSLVNTDQISINEYKKLANTIDTAFSKEISVFGSNSIFYTNTINTDESTKLDILIYDLFSDANPNAGSVTYGFFRHADMMRNNVSLTTSNECEVIHIDSYCWKQGIDGYEDANGNTIHSHAVESTLLHEFQHLLNFCNKDDDYQSWFTEMLSMSCEEVLQDTINTSDRDSPKSRFDIYFDKPYLGFGNWPSSSSDRILYAYCNAYAFGTYLMRNYGGIKLIHEIATNNYVDGEAVTHALQTLGYNETFESVVRKFGMVYIFADGNGITLNTEKYQNFNGSLYKLSHIDLDDYYFHKYSSYSEMTTDIASNIYYPKSQIISGHDSSGNYYLAGPTIYKNIFYRISDQIEPYGFSVYYLGTVQSGETYTIRHESDLYMTVVLRD